ncbi:SH3-domain-containing protein [Schizophyllum commune Loenen D]|nr:SH3-domain-containing protein [Schizophyllum commune Loenen D]
MTAPDPLLAHIVSRVEADVEFLISQNYINQADASHLLQRLTQLQAGGGQQATTFPTPTPASTFTPAYNTPKATPPAPAPRAAANPPAQQARAKWPYNEDGSDPDDLSFSEGDVIEIVEETNADWWTGRARGKQGLFPATYVEKITAPFPPARSLPPAYTGAKEKPVYKPFGGAAYNPPPSNAPPQQPAAPSTNSVGLQQDTAGQEQKKSKFGKYGNTMAHSAAGGVGFGAGAAIGGGLVRAIF